MTLAEQLLKNLVDALDSAFISSWQTTAHWDEQLEAAREYVRTMKEAKHLLAAQSQQEAIGEVQHYAAPANLPAYVNVNWHGKPPKNGTKVYFLNPKD